MTKRETEHVMTEKLTIQIEIYFKNERKLKKFKKQTQKQYLWRRTVDTATALQLTKSEIRMTPK